MQFCRVQNPSTPCKNDNKTCTVSPLNPFNDKTFFAHLYDDLVAAHSTDSTAVEPDTYPTHFAFACFDDPNKSSLTSEAILGLGRSDMSLPIKLAASHNLPPKFALYAPSSNKRGFGDLFIGGGPYTFPGGDDASRWLAATPLVGSDYSEYFVTMKSIKFDERTVRDLDASSLSTKISTSTFLDVMRSSVFAAVAGEFSRQATARNITSAAVVAVSFGACFGAAGVRWTRAGPRVPAIDMELEGNMGIVKWRLHGENSMVRVSEEVMCLGFVDGGAEARDSIVLGGLQIEDNFLEFDLTTSRLGFSSSLLPRGASCSNFRNR